METTNQQVYEFRMAAAAYLDRDQKRAVRGTRKFTWAVQRMFSRTKTLVEAYHDAQQNANVDTAAIEPEKDRDGKPNPRAGLLVATPAGSTNYDRSKAEETRRMVAYRDAAKMKVEIEAYVAVPGPNDLSDFEIEAFSDFIIEDPEQAFLNSTYVPPPPSQGETK